MAMTGYVVPMVLAFFVLSVGGAYLAYRLYRKPPT